MRRLAEHRVANMLLIGAGIGTHVEALIRRDAKLNGMFPSESPPEP